MNEGLLSNITLEGRKLGTAIKDDFLVKEGIKEIFRSASRIFAEKGYHQTTIRDISQASGIGLGTIVITLRRKRTS